MTNTERKRFLNTHLYLKYSSAIHVILLLFVSIGIWLGLFSKFKLLIFPTLLILVIITPSYFIMPHLIYEDYEASSLSIWNPFKLDSLKHDLFFVVTLGLGPIYLFFKYHSRELKNKNK